MKRLLIVSNRLPVSVKREKGQWTLSAGGGGLVSGLEPVRSRQPTLWIGWPGLKEDLSADDKRSLAMLLHERGLAPVHMGAKLVHRYYDDFCNGIVWPLFHFLPMQLPIELSGFEEFEEANRLFADEVARHYQPDDVIWVQDYQLALVPAMLRERFPKARIGFFLHIPFPSSEMFRVLPWRRQFLEGMLGSDLIGFHTALYANNFASSVLRILGAEPRVESMIWRGRKVRYGTYPLGIDLKQFEGEANGSASDELAQLRQTGGVERILLGVDRLDYTKGIPRRLVAFQKLLEEHPELRGKVVLVQVAVPGSREAKAFEDTKRVVEELVGRINGRFGSPGHQPIHYIARSFSTKELVGLYREADVMLVTPLRDGMNLVAKEFCASRVDEDGVLVLSEFAGAASELGEAFLVNPYDVSGMAKVYHQALTLPKEQRVQRMQALRQRLGLLSNERWTDAFLSRLGRVDAKPPRSLPISAEETLSLAGGGKQPLALILDYDGTVVPIAQLPELALPDDELLLRIEHLSERPDVHLVILSGRSKDFINRWFGRFSGVSLFAEHGLWHRARGSSIWECRLDPSGGSNWKSKVRAMLDQACIEAPGSLVEEKTASLVWHYRMVDPDLGRRKARELRFQLTEALANLPVEVTTGKRIVEVRRSGVSKAAAVHSTRQEVGENATYLAIGDDETDEEMFRALPPRGCSIRVGGPSSGSRFYLPDVDSVRRFLKGLDERSGGTAELRRVP